MKILEKIVRFFIKAKKLAAETEQKINKFIRDYKREILMIMSLLETLFPANTGAKKMGCVVGNVCTALGYDNLSDDVVNFVTKKCQEVYDEFKTSLK